MTYGGPPSLAPAARLPLSCHPPVAPQCPRPVQRLTHVNALLRRIEKNRKRMLDLGLEKAAAAIAVSAARPPTKYAAC